MIAPFARRNIAEPRRRMIRLDAEGDNASRFRRLPRNADRGVESRKIADMMIARADEQEFVFARR